jgi:hypothetical protein
MKNVDPLGCFFLLSNEPIVGSVIEMEITLPGELGDIATGKFLCQGKVIQIEKENESGRTGVRCSIERYRLIPAAADCEMAEEAGGSQRKRRAPDASG